MASLRSDRNETPVDVPLHPSLLTEEISIIFLLGNHYEGRRFETIKQSSALPGVTVKAVYIPFGQKYNAVEAQCHAAGLSCTRQVKKAEYEGLLLEERPTVVFSLGWPFILGEKVVGQHPFVLNAHGARLPQYRGNYPFYAVLGNNDAEAFVTVHHVDLGMDTGAVIQEGRAKLTPFDTWGSCADKVIGQENAVVPLVLARLAAGGDVGGVAQPAEGAGVTGKSARWDPSWHQVDANVSLAEAYHKVRAVDPGHGPAWVEIEGEKVFIQMWREEKKPETDFPGSL